MKILQTSRLGNMLTPAGLLEYVIHLQFTQNDIKLNELSMSPVLLMAAASLIQLLN